MSQRLPERRSRPATALWGPFSEFEQVAERMRRMLEQTFGGVEWPADVARGSWSPLVDVREVDDAYVVEAELPGVKREDVDIELVGNELAISGDVKDEREREGTIRQKMRRSGRFDYRLRLPEQVEPEGIEATLAEGVLTVRAPKSERAERRTIEIKA